MTAGEPAPAFVLPTIGARGELGPPVTLASSFGKVTVVDFWASWCGPCLRALPKLDALARRHSNDVVVIAIAVQDDAKDARAVFDDGRLAITLLADDGKTSERYGVGPIPHTVVIDRQGVVRRVARGGGIDLEAEVAKLLR
jgi:thiol-disulfide isomerase/thioredoxin